MMHLSSFWRKVRQLFLIENVQGAECQNTIAAILQTPHADFELRHVDVQRQVGGSDCGLFAFILAFATALCSDLDPFACSYKQTQMHSHLLKCFENQQMTTFPSPDHPRRLAHCRLLSTKESLFIVFVGCHGISMTKRGAL